MGTTIKLRCIDQVLALTSTPLIASGGLDEDFIQVGFCSKWDGLTRTAVFWKTEGDVFHVTLDENNVGRIPPEVLTDEGSIYFGLFGVSADGKQRTSEVVRYNIVKGAITTGTKPSAPTPDIYTQLLAKYQTIVETSEATYSAERAFEANVAQRQTDYETGLTARQTDYETGLTARQEGYETGLTARQEGYETGLTQRQTDFEAEMKVLIAPANPDQHQVVHSRKLDVIGLSDANMVATDAKANLAAIYSAMPVDSELWLTLSSSANYSPNLWGSLMEKLQADMVLTWTSPLLVRLVRRSDVLEVHAVACGTSYYMQEYSCTFRYYVGAGHYLTTFSVTRDPAGFVKKSGDIMTVGATLRFQGSNGTGLGIKAVSEGSNITAYDKAGDESSNRNLLRIYPPSLKSQAEAMRTAEVKDGKTTWATILHTGNMNALLGGFAKVVTGSYVGTGTYGEDNPNSLTFDGVVKMLWIFALDRSGTYHSPTVPSATSKNVVTDTELTTNWTKGVGLGYLHSNHDAQEWGCWGKKSEDGKTIYWHSDYTIDGNEQFNLSGSTYYYIAIIQ